MFYKFTGKSRNSCRCNDKILHTEHGEHFSAATLYLTQLPILRNVLSAYFSTKACKLSIDWDQQIKVRLSPTIRPHGTN